MIRANLTAAERDLVTTALGIYARHVTTLVDTMAVEVAETEAAGRDARSKALTLARAAADRVQAGRLQRTLSALPDVAIDLATAVGNPRGAVVVATLPVDPRNALASVPADDPETDLEQVLADSLTEVDLPPHTGELIVTTDQGPAAPPSVETVA